MSEFMQTDLPEPVVPAISRCGSCEMSPLCIRPDVLSDGNATLLRLDISSSPQGPRGADYRNRLVRNLYTDNGDLVRIGAMRTPVTRGKGNVIGDAGQLVSFMPLSISSSYR